MAIQHNISEANSDYGISFSGAYYRIVTASISRQRGTDPKFSVMIDLSAYATATPKDDTREVDFKRYSANLTDVEAKSGSTFMDKCYAWVMDQDDMDGSTAAQEQIMSVLLSLQDGFYRAVQAAETVGTISGSTLDFDTGNVFSHAPSSNVTYVFNNPPVSGIAYGFTLKVTPSATVTVTWPSGVDWAGGSAPDAPASGETNVYSFYTVDGGTTYYGFLAGAAMG